MSIIKYCITNARCDSLGTRSRTVRAVRRVRVSAVVVGRLTPRKVAPTRRSSALFRAAALRCAAISAAVSVQLVRLVQLPLLGALPLVALLQSYVVLGECLAQFQVRFHLARVVDDGLERLPDCGGGLGRSNDSENITF